MKIILLSGGSGKRLWPMSNDSRSKQFLRVLHSPEGMPISMLQKVFSQLQRVHLDKHAYVCASRAQKDIIEYQLGTIPFIEEPERRDTFPAIALATLCLKDIHHVAKDEVIIVIPIDHEVDDSYFTEIARLEQVLKESQADLALMGVVPTEPTSKFGYIHSDQEASDFPWRKVDFFVEKPPVEQAAHLIEEGALWNCGIFSFRLGTLVKHLEGNEWPTSYLDFLQEFPQLPKRSFDHAFVETTTSVVVLPYQGKWKDIGTWEALSEELDEPFLGKGELIECEDTQVINELGIPLVAMGLKNAIIVTTPDGMLVADKSMSSRIKDVANQWSDRPMVEERYWGTYKVMDYQKLENGTEVLTKWVEVDTGHHLKYQKHHSRMEIWTIVDGIGEVVLNGQVRIVRAGDVIPVTEGTWHTIRAIMKLRFIEVQRGQELIEEDVERSELSWDEILLKSIH